MRSALYEGVVVHRRHAPVRHVFRYRLGLLYLALEEREQVFAGRLLWGIDRPGLAVFRRRDHLGDPDRPLDAAVRDLVEARTGRRPAGPVDVLTCPRSFGLSFNPVSFFYCFAPGRERLDALVAEVTNTPWNERHCYVLPLADAPRRARSLALSTPKSFHVSPFMPMAQDYDWVIREPGARLGLAIGSREGGRRVFDATLALTRREISGGTLAGALVRHPFMSARMLAAIYREALRLHRRGVSFHPHPRTRAAAAGEEVISA